MEQQEQQGKAKILEMPKPKTKYLAIQDDESGEFDALIRLDKNRKGGWFKVFQDSLNWLSEQALTGEQLRVLLKLMSRLDYDNYIRVSQKELAAELGMKDTHISRAIRKLRELDVIVEAPRMGKYKLYRLNPRMGYKGKHPEQTVIEYDELKRRKENKENKESRERKGED